MLSRASGFRVTFHQKQSPKDRISHVDLELWLERNLRERAGHSKRGSEERLKVFAEMLDKIAESEPIFGCFIERALMDIFAERTAAPPEVQALQRLIVQEKRLAELKVETKQAEDENEKLRQQLKEIQHHIDRRRTEMQELQKVLLQKADIFEKQRQLNDDLTQLFKVFDEPLVVKEDVKETDAPQIVSLRLHNKSLREKVKAMQKNIQIAEEEIETIRHIR
jgi:uncharacterized protein YhaN